MIFYRSQGAAIERSIKSVRLISVTTLVAYPAGALTLALGPDTLIVTLVGYGLILLALMCAAALIRSSVQRVVAEEVAQLDEYELQIRNRAMATAYSIFTGMVLAAVIYAALATERGAWVPSTTDEYNGLFWGIFLYAFTLPTACLAWRLDPSAEQTS